MSEGNNSQRRKNPNRPNQSAKLKRRRKMIMRKRIMLLGSAVVVIAIIVAALIGVIRLLTHDVEQSTLTIQEDGSIISEELQAFQEEYYSKKELKAYSTEAIKEYNEQVGSEAIKLKKVSVKQDVAYMKLEFASYKDYTDFTGYEMFVGTIKEAKKAGYQFGDTYVMVAEGKKGKNIPTEDVLSQEENQVVILKQNIAVEMKKPIKIVSDCDTVMVSDTCVSIEPTDGNYDATELRYIITKGK